MSKILQTQPIPNAPIISSTKRAEETDCKIYNMISISWNWFRAAMHGPGEGICGKIFIILGQRFTYMPPYVVVW